MDSTISHHYHGSLRNLPRAGGRKTSMTSEELGNVYGEMPRSHSYG